MFALSLTLTHDRPGIVSGPHLAHTDTLLAHAPTEPGDTLHRRARTAAGRSRGRRSGAFTFRRMSEQKRSLGHAAVRGVCYRFGLAATSLYPDHKGNLDSDYTARHGIGPQGCALPPDADASWTDVLTWADRIEQKDKRKNSRHFKDDVIGIPIELIASGRAEDAIGAYATRLARYWRTPVHWVIHDADGPNPHAHVIYAGRAVEGAQFTSHRDRRQDQLSRPLRGQKSLTELHSQWWIEVGAEFDLELSFSPDGARATEHVGPQRWAQEKVQIRSDIGAVIGDALALDEADPRDPLDVASAASAELSVTQAREMRAMKEAPRQRRRGVRRVPTPERPPVRGDDPRWPILETPLERPWATGPYALEPVAISAVVAEAVQAPPAPACEATPTAPPTVATSAVVAHQVPPAPRCSAAPAEAPSLSAGAARAAPAPAPAPLATAPPPKPVTVRANPPAAAASPNAPGVLAVAGAPPPPAPRAASTPDPALAAPAAQAAQPGPLSWTAELRAWASRLQRESLARRALDTILSSDAIERVGAAVADLKSTDVEGLRPTTERAAQDAIRRRATRFQVSLFRSTERAIRQWRTWWRRHAPTERPRIVDEVLPTHLQEAEAAHQAEVAERARQAAITAELKEMIDQMAAERRAGPSLEAPAPTPAQDGPRQQPQQPQQGIHRGPGRGRGP